MTLTPKLDQLSLGLKFNINIAQNKIHAQCKMNDRYRALYPGVGEGAGYLIRTRLPAKSSLSMLSLLSAIFLPGSAARAIVKSD